MRKLLSIPTLGTLLLIASFVEVGQAKVSGPDEYGGHGSSQCEAPTHVSYYDPRNDGQTVYDYQGGNGDNVFYVDTEPLAGFDPDGDYQTTQTPDQDCKGTPVLRSTVFVAATVMGEDPVDTQHVGFPRCPRDPGDERNPHCEDEHTGVRGAFYVATADGSQQFGRSAGVTNPLTDP